MPLQSLAPLSNWKNTFDWYVDSVNGSDSNNGKSAGKAFATISKLESMTIAAGARIGLAKGSTWREQLDISVNNVTIKAYGSGNKPIFDCTDVQTNANFSKTASFTYLYNIAISTNYVAAEPSFVSVWEDSTRLAIATSQANCDATAGTYWVSGHNATSITVHIHASDNSAITSNGKTYEISTRGSGVYAFYADRTFVEGIHCKRNYSEGGSLKLGTNSIALNCTASDGNKHNAYFRTGSTIKNCTFSDAYYNASATLLVVNEGTPNNEGATISGCTFSNNSSGLSPTLIGPHNSHNNVSGSFGTITVENCTYSGFRTSGAMFAFNHCSTVTVTNPTFTDCNIGITSPSSPTAGGSMTVTGGTWSNAAGTVKRAITTTDTGGTPLIVDGMTIYLDAAVDTGLVSITLANANFTIRNCTFSNRLASGNRIAIWCQNNTANLTLSTNTFTGTSNWSQLYQFQAGASGMTWASDNNVFGPNFSMSIFGTTYSSLATYRTATGKDTNST